MPAQDPGHSLLPWHQDQSNKILHAEKDVLAFLLGWSHSVRLMHGLIGHEDKGSQISLRENWRESLLRKVSGYSRLNRYFRKDIKSEAQSCVVQKHKPRIIQNQTGLDLAKEIETKNFTERVFPCLKGKQERKKWVYNKREVKIYND